MVIEKKSPIKVIIGLGNPGKQFHKTRHNIGFLVLDSLVDKYGGVWEKRGDKEVAQVTINDEKVLLVKPQTYMNSSGKVIPSLLKQGLTAEHLLVVHDELEKPFGTVEVKKGGSHKGHNGLRSIIEFCGAEFKRLRCGIGRPVHKEDVAAYVLNVFDEYWPAVEEMIENAVDKIGDLIVSQ